MEKRDFSEMVSYFNREVADMNIARKYKMELLGMITAIEMEHYSAVQERTAAAPWNPDRNRYCCDSCGSYIGKYDKYCNGCGARLTDWTPDGRGKRK